MERRDVEEWAIKLSAVTDRLDVRLNHAAQQSLQTMAATERKVDHAREASDKLIASAIETFRREASSAVTDGLRDAMTHLEETVRSGASQLGHATQQVEQRIRVLQAMHTANAWKAFVACAVACVAVLGATGYLMWKARQDLTQTQWVSEINRAEASGKLAPCPEGGICVLVNKKWVRLDSSP